jgi:hypothetical protein
VEKSWATVVLGSHFYNFRRGSRNAPRYARAGGVIAGGQIFSFFKDSLQGAKMEAFILFSFGIFGGVLGEAAGIMAFQRVAPNTDLNGLGLGFFGCSLYSEFSVAEFWCSLTCGPVCR